MIRRDPSKYTQNQELLSQYSFTALNGIDGSKPPVDETTVLRAVNLDVDTDGGLILRKPLIACKEFPNAKKVFHSYVENTYICVYLEDNLYSLRAYSNDTELKISLVFTDTFGKQYTVTNSNVFFDLSNVDAVNSVSSTILTGVYVNHTTLPTESYTWFYEGTTSNALKARALRYLRFVCEDDTVKIYVINPEINTLAEDELGIVFNQTLDNVFSVRDNYNSSTVSVKNILAYYTDYILQEPYTESLSIVFNHSGGATTSSKNITDGIQTIACIVEPHNDFPNVETATITLTAVTKCTVCVKTVDNIYFKILNADEFFTIPNCFWTDTYGDTLSTTFVFANVSLIKNSATVAELTESSSSKIVESFSTDVLSTSNTSAVLLKAFVGFVPNSSPYYCTWEKSYDGVDWQCLYDASNPIGRIAYEVDNISDSLTEDTVSYKPIYVCPFGMSPYEDAYLSPSDAYVTRPDVLYLRDLDLATYRFRVFTTSFEKINVNDEYPSLKIKTVLASKSYTPLVTPERVVLDSSDFKNTVQGDKLYYKKRIYTYGEVFKNNIHVTLTDSFITPTYNVIDLDTSSDSCVTAVVPWRDYLIACTDKTIHLITPQDAGFLTKTVSTYIGVSKEDANTCCSILNGIIFKSKNKIYTMYPNFSSGSETILNISEISKPVEHILSSASSSTRTAFAFVDYEAYYLFIPDDSGTLCLKYNFNRKLWTEYYYNVVLYSYYFNDVSDVRLLGVFKDTLCEYKFNRDLQEFGYDNSDTYGDVLTINDLNNKHTASIPFHLDSGYKSNNISLTKQFVESKIIVASLDNNDSFQLDVDVYIDGDLFTKHLDVHTDGALLRYSDAHILTLGTSTIVNDSSDVFNVLRQMFMRYSGKGKSVRHIVSGCSLYRFKLYEVFYRYKSLNVKQ